MLPSRVTLGPPRVIAVDGGDRAVELRRHRERGAQMLFGVKGRGDSQRDGDTSGATNLTKGSFHGWFCDFVFVCRHCSQESFARGTVLFPERVSAPMSSPDPDGLVKAASGVPTLFGCILALPPLINSLSSIRWRRGLGRGGAVLKRHC